MATCKAAETGALPYLIPLTKGDPADPEVKTALAAYEALKAHLARACGLMDPAVSANRKKSPKPGR